jgi:hypothetical protein
VNFAKETINRIFFTDRWRWTNINEMDKKMILNIKELSSIVHFPHARFNLNPRISRQRYKIIPAPDNLPLEWILLWYNTYGWVKKEVRLRIDNDDRFRHVYILWQTGSGKSTLMRTSMLER